MELNQTLRYNEDSVVDRRLDQVRMSITKQEDRADRYYNANQINNTYSKGDLVLLKNLRIESNAIHIPWLGPFEVIEQKDVNYKVKRIEADIPTTAFWTHIHRLKRYYPRSNASLSTPAASARQVLPASSIAKPSTEELEFRKSVQSFHKADSRTYRIIFKNGNIQTVSKEYALQHIPMLLQILEKGLAR